MSNLDDAIELYEGERGREPTDEELRVAGIEPGENETGDGGPPEVLD